MKNSSKSIYFLDFDLTLFDGPALFQGPMRDAVRIFGIDDACWNESYEAVLGNGYTPRKHAREIARQLPGNANAQVISDALEDSLTKVNIKDFVYSDVIHFIDRMRETDARICIVSFGSPEWQHFKLKKSGIDAMVDDIFITDQPGYKWQTIARESEGYERIIFADDNKKELDAAKKHLPHLQTYWVLRSQDGIPNQITDVLHTYCHNLRTIA